MSASRWRCGCACPPRSAPTSAPRARRRSLPGRRPSSRGGSPRRASACSRSCASTGPTSPGPTCTRRSSSPSSQPGASAPSRSTTTSRRSSCTTAAARLDLTDSMKIAQSDKVQSSLGLTGKGVNVAVYENGPDDIVAAVDHRAVLERARRPSSTPATPTGSSRTSSPTSRTGTRGMQPALGQQHGPRRHHAGRRTTRGCTVISQSFHRDAEQTDSGLSFDDMYKDWLVLHWPYPTILQAAGQRPQHGVRQPQGLQQPHGRQPRRHGGRPGQRLGRAQPGVRPQRPRAARAGRQRDGRHHGRADVQRARAWPRRRPRACTALMQEANATLQSWPEGCRAILLAARQQEHHRQHLVGRPQRRRRRRRTARAPSTASRPCASRRTAARRGPRRARRGWDVGTLRSSDIGAGDETTFSWQVTVPQPALQREGQGRAGLGQLRDGRSTSRSCRSRSTSCTVDLDLQGLRQPTARRSATAARRTTATRSPSSPPKPGETYTIKIRRWSGTADVWYGVAWSVQGTPLIRPNWDLDQILTASP